MVDVLPAANREPRSGTGAISLALGCLVATLLAGCFEIDTHIRLHEDGSATITEKVSFSQRLLDLDRTAQGNGGGMAELLSRKAVEERMKHMGEGIRLQSHEIREGERASRVSVSVFRIDDIGEFRYVSPFFAVGNYAENNAIRAEIFPLTENTWWGRRSGEMALRFTQARRTGGGSGDDEEPRPPSPREVQIYRDLQPVFRDMVEGMRLRIAVEVYAPVRVRGGYRGSRAGTHEFDLIDFSWRDMDQYGYDFLGNEEIMLELLRGELDGANLVETVEEHPTNVTVPVYHPTGANEIWFRPSRPLFDKHFEGKQITVSRNRQNVQVPARWENIGYDPDPNRRNNRSND